MAGVVLEDERSRIGRRSSDAIAADDPDCAPNDFAQFACGGHCCWIVAQDKLPSGANFVLAGDVHIDGQTYSVLYDKATPPGENVQAGANLAEVLTRRELQIVALVASGRVNKQIAHLLNISEYTVSTHLRRIFCKLGVSSRAAMVAHVVGHLHLEAGHVHPAQRAESGRFEITHGNDRGQAPATDENPRGIAGGGFTTLVLPPCSRSGSKTV